MSDWAKPLSRFPEAMASTLATAPLELCAIATSPGTPQLPPLSHGRAPGGLLMMSAIRPPIG
jgi:hypothetical protein